MDHVCDVFKVSLFWICACVHGASGIMPVVVICSGHRMMCFGVSWLVCLFRGHSIAAAATAIF